MHELELYRMTCQNGLEERVFEKDPNYFGTVLKVWQKKTCKRAAFLETLQAVKISLHKEVNSSRKVFQTYLEICIFLLMR